MFDIDKTATYIIIIMAITIIILGFILKIVPNIKDNEQFKDCLNNKGKTYCTNNKCTYDNIYILNGEYYGFITPDNEKGSRIGIYYSHNNKEECNARGKE